VNHGALGTAADGTYGVTASLDAPGLLARSNDTAVAFPSKSVESRMVAAGFPFPSAALTVTFLVQGEDLGLSYFVGYGVAGSFNEFGLGSNAGAFRTVFNGNIQDYSGVDVLDGVAHHIAVTWTAATGLTELFVDGVSTASRTVTQGTPLTASGVLALGQDLDSLTSPNYGFDPDQSFVGTLDEFAVFDRVLTAAEIGAQVQAATAPAPSTGPIEYFVQFQSALGSTYTMDTSIDLENWSAIKTPIIGTGGLLRYFFTTAAPETFYRVESPARMEQKQ
jgi:CUB/sushi domain-containing protein